MNTDSYLCSALMQNRCRLYIITPPIIDIGIFSVSLKSALEAGDVSCVQLRLKCTDDATICRATETLLPICHDNGVVFLINDRPDLAIKLGADGTHIGADDADYHSARKIMGNDAIIGVSCYDSRHLALKAGEAGADYVAFGAFYPTDTKTPKTKAKLDILKWCHDVTILLSVAIGGITAQNCTPLVKAGADFIAVVSAIWDHPAGTAIAVKTINDAIAEAASS